MHLHFVILRKFFLKNFERESHKADKESEKRRTLVAPPAGAHTKTDPMRERFLPPFIPAANVKL
jgi:hypothetical protein